MTLPAIVTPATVNTATLGTLVTPTVTSALGNTTTLLLPLRICVPPGIVRLLSNPPSPIKYPPAVTFPDDDITLVAALKVNPADAPALPALLNMTCVLEPGTVKLPVMLPAKIPMK